MNTPQRQSGWILEREAMERRAREAAEAEAQELAKKVVKPKKGRKS